MTDRPNQPSKKDLPKEESPFLEEINTSGKQGPAEQSNGVEPKKIDGQTAQEKSTVENSLAISPADNRQLALNRSKSEAQISQGLTPLEITGVPEKSKPQDSRDSGDKGKTGDKAEKTEKTSWTDDIFAAGKYIDPIARGFAFNNLGASLVPIAVGASDAFFGPTGPQTHRANEFKFDSNGKSSSGWFSDALKLAKSTMNEIVHTGQASLDISALFKSTEKTRTSSPGDSSDQKPKVTKDAAGNIHYESNRNGQTVEADVSKDHGHFRAGKTEIDQSRNDGTDHDIKAQVVDKNGSTITHEQKDGTSKTSNSDSDYTVERKGKEFSIVDKSGEEIMKFQSRGGLERFLNHSTLAVTQPGENLEQAAERIKKERDQTGKDKDKSLLITDGDGNSLSIDPRGRTVKRFEDGRVEITQNHKDDSGEEQKLRVLIEPGTNGDVIKIAHGDGEYQIAKDMNREQLEKMLRGSDFRLDGEKVCVRCHGKDRSDKDGVKHDSAADFEPLIADGQIKVTPDTVVHRRDGKMVIKEGDREVTVDRDKESGRTQIIEKLKGEDTRVTYIEKNGEVKTTDPKNEKDTISFDPSSNTVKAWDNIITPDKTTLLDGDGNKTIIDEHGNFDTVDRHGHNIIHSDTDGVHLPDSVYIDPYGNIHDLQEEAQLQAAQEMAENQAVNTAAQVIGQIQGLLAAASVIQAGAISGLMGMIDQAKTLCLMLGIDPPASLEVARNNVLSAAGQINHEYTAQQKVVDQVGVITPEMAAFIRNSGTQNPDLSAQYAIDAVGLNKTKNA